MRATIRSDGCGIDPADKAAVQSILHFGTDVLGCIRATAKPAAILDQAEEFDPPLPSEPGRRIRRFMTLPERSPALPLNFS